MHSVPESGRCTGGMWVSGAAPTRQLSLPVIARRRGGDNRGPRLALRQSKWQILRITDKCTFFFFFFNLLSIYFLRFDPAAQSPSKPEIHICYQNTSCKFTLNYRYGTPYECYIHREYGTFITERCRIPQYKS